MSEQNIQNPFDKENKTIYDLFDCFIQRVIIEKKSIFNIKGDEIFTKEILNEIKTRFIDNGIGSPDKGKEIFEIREEKDKNIDEYIKLKNNVPEIRTELFAYKLQEDGDLKDFSFIGKLNYQFNTLKINNQPATDLVKKLMTHILWLRYLPISDMVKKTKPNYINLLDNELVKEKYIPNGIADYSYKRQNVPEETKYLIELLLDLCNIEYLDSKDIKDIKDIKDEIKKLILDTSKPYNKSGNNESKLAIRSMLLHLCDQDHYEPIASYGDKLAIVRNLYEYYVKDFKNDDKKNKLKCLNNSDISKWDDYKVETNFLKDENLDEKLYILKQIIKKVHPEITFKYESEGIRNGFYHDTIFSKWKNEYVANGYEILTNYKKEIILYGAPGTGKTYSAMKIVEEFINEDENDKPIDEDKSKLDAYKFDYCYCENDATTKKECIKNISEIGTNNNYEIKLKVFENKDGENNDCGTNNNENKNIENESKVIWDIIQFNQSFSYEDFLEGLRPDKDAKLIIVDGVFKRFAQVAKQNPTKHFIFIIDEINRGKTDKIFGELLYLLEYRDKTVRLHYSGEDFSIPENVYIIGTMNTADKSIALLDVALRRRFWFVKCEPSIEVIKNNFKVYNYDVITNDDTPENIKKIALKLFEFLNGKDGKDGAIDENTLGDDANELKIGHSYFLKLVEKDIESIEKEPTFSDLKNIWFYSIVPLLEEYCGFNKSKLSEMLLFNKNKDLSKMSDFTLDNLKSLK